MNDGKFTFSNVLAGFCVGVFLGSLIEDGTSEQPKNFELNTACVHYSRGYNIGVEDGFAKGVQATRHDMSMRDLNEPIGCALEATEIEHNEEYSR